MKELTDSCVSATLRYIKDNGVSFGNRWRVLEEGTGSYEALVFRDMKSSEAGVDNRYAMYAGVYHDL